MKLYKDRCLDNMHLLSELLEEEHRRQLKQFGVQEHSLYKWVTCIMEELGELSEAILENDCGAAPLTDVTREALEVATLALKVVEMTREDCT